MAVEMTEEESRYYALLEQTFFYKIQGLGRHGNGLSLTRRQRGHIMDALREAIDEARMMTNDEQPEVTK